MKKKLCVILSIILLFCFHFSGCREFSDYAASLLDAKCDELIDYFSEVALCSGSGGDVIVHWETPIHIEVKGEYTEEDYSALTDSINKLNSLNVMPKISIVDKGANFFVYFLPIDKMAEYIPDYNEGNWWSYKVDWKFYKIYKAYIGIATDVSTQKERNYMILAAISASIGFFNKSSKYHDSILYPEWTKVQSLSDLDFELIRLLYSPSLHAGMDEEQVKKALGPLVKEKCIDTYVD